MKAQQAHRKSLGSALASLALSAVVSVLFALVPAASASAATITYVSLTGAWRDATDNLPGSQPGDPVITNGNPTSIIRWGTVTSTPQSGYDFTAASPLPPPFDLPGVVPFFSLGSFVHRNFAVDDPSLTSVQLDVSLVISVDGVPRPPLTFTYTFNHVETPNELDPCPFDPVPPPDGCSDRVSIVASPTPTTFNVDGVDYTLALSFLDPNGNPVSQFITSEGGVTNTTGLVGQFTPPPGTPVIIVDKSGPAKLKPAEFGTFGIDLHNTGNIDAHNVTLVDRLPDTPTGGMCTTPPQILSARVFAADGVTPVPGKGPLVQGTDYSAVYNGAACELTFNTLSAASVIGVDERLVISYRAQVDADAQNGTVLTNVAGATRWLNPGNVIFTRVMTDGTPTVMDHEDAYSVTVDQPQLKFDKTVTDVTSGQNPATHATPGDTLRYRIRIENLATDPLPNFSLRDELGRLNTSAVYVPGTLNVVTLPAGADASNTNPSGGVNNSGVVDIRNLSLGGQGTFVVIEYDVRLAPALPNQSYVQNQAQAYVGGIEVGRSDDPNIGATPPDPLVLGDEDPTRVQITSAPKFRVLKTSTYLGASTTVLRAGDRMRYTITVKNIGTDNATGVVIRDQIPTNTTYVANSTTLNGTQQNDNAQGISPLVDTIAIYAPENATAGVMRADATSTTSNVATITFDVTVYPDLADGTIISNQAFVSAVDFGIVDYPSDDPRTPIVNDPTRDVVGNVPLLFATKQAELVVDNGSPGIVDPGDTLRYTITMYNNGTIPATNVVLADNVPPNTTYVADTTTLNGLPYGQPDNGSSPLAAGIYVSSSDRTPPLPTAGEGTLSPNSSAVVQFNLRVNAGVPSGTLIRNQAAVHTTEVPNLLTDGDGNPSTGPEPTVVVVGNGQQLSIVKEVSVVGGGAASQGKTLEYVVRVTNISQVPALYVVITDDLNMPVPGYLALVANSVTLNAQTTGISVANQVITADYSTTYGPLQPQQTATLRFRAVINPDLLDGTKVTNIGTVKWNNPPQTASASVTIDVGAIPGQGILNGKAWHDANFSRTQEANEHVLEGWTVQLYRNNQLFRSTTTDVNGVYRISGIPPNYITGEPYELRFSAPDATSNSAKLGLAYSATFTNGLQKISDIIVQFAANLQDLNLPISPNGVVYNSVSRAPTPGVTLRMLTAGSRTTLPAACFDDPAQQNQVTRADGYYRFDLNFTDPACPSGGDFLIDVSPPPTGYIGTYSQIIPPTSGPSTSAFSVPTCPGGVDDALSATSDYCEVQTSEFAPTLAARARSAGTRYYANLKLDNNLIPGSSQIYNNHIPVDPDLQGAIQISKTTPLLNVVRGQLVPYVITYKNVTEVPLFDVSIVDRIPAGFRYVEGSALLDRQPVEPAVAGRELIWSDLAVDRQEQHELLVILAVGAGVSEGEFVNRVQAVHMLTANALSNEASATVRVVPDPTFDCTDVTGKVFDDANRNGLQDPGETGLPGVRVVSARGLAATTDAYGRYHITCAIVPREGRGSNFVLKLDDRTLPSGFRSSTNQTKVERATRGKSLKFNFGASLHRVIGLDLADAVFEPGTTEMRAQWRPRLDMLMKELQKAPAILRLSYLADVENEQLVQRRLEAIKSEIASRWQSQNANAAYQLTIEPEVFWRLGAPPQQAREESR
ncbi:MAG TPA: choice-of-anchor K domain-containing protein [Steroidobacteraceae bacterium]|jgi:large repetitive protein|nr:choice-of-anchor K domain-containing protein [Steroidobacteraceae bacterium]